MIIQKNTHKMHKNLQIERAKFVMKYYKKSKSVVHKRVHNAVLQCMVLEELLGGD